MKNKSFIFYLFIGLISLACSTNEKVPKNHLTLNNLEELHSEAVNMHADVLALAEYQKARSLHNQVIVTHTKNNHKAAKKLIEKAMSAYIQAENKALSVKFTPQDILIARDYLVDGNYQKNESIQKKQNSLDLELYDETDMFFRPLSDERAEYYLRQYQQLEIAALSENMKLIESKIKKNKKISKTLADRYSKLKRTYRESMDMAQVTPNNPWSVMANLNRTLLSSSLLLEVLDSTDQDSELDQEVESNLSE